MFEKFFLGQITFDDLCDYIIQILCNEVLSSLEINY